MDDHRAAIGLRVPDDRTTWQALRTWTLYRILVTLLLAGFFFTPILGSALPPGQARLAQVVTAVFLVLAPALYGAASRYARRPGLQALVGSIADLTLTALLLAALGTLDSGVSTLLVGSMALVGAIAPLRLALLFASGGTLIVLWHALHAIDSGAGSPSMVTAAGTLGAAFFVTTLVGSYLASRARESQALAHQRSMDLANLAELNELIIERMRTGIVIVDDNRNAHLMNEAAWYLAGMPETRTNKLPSLSPRLAEALDHWRTRGVQPEASLKLGSGVPPIVPRFAALTGDPRGDVLVFLEDTAMLSRRAHELTLASLGRLSASIAHEIRNPLAAISHSAQLLREAEGLPEADARLVAIIQRHCGRMNDIVENVLHLARQQRTRPGPLHLDAWLRGFLEEFRRFHEVGAGQLELTGGQGETWILVDASQLQQVMWNLCQNALKYGRRAQQPAYVSIDWGPGTPPQGPWLEVRDKGPGIPEEARERLFEPFFTTSDDGSGLGLYLCQQLVEANQGTIRYDFDGDGSRFTVSFSRSPPGDPAGGEGRAVASTGTAG